MANRLTWTSNYRRVLNITLPIYLIGAVRNARRLKVTDPLDRVYGMLNLTVDCRPSDIDIDYKKPQQKFTQTL